VKAYPIRLIEEAEAELLAEYDWYLEHAGQTVADRFRTLVLTKIDRVGMSPEAYPVFDEPVRRCLLGRFPHGVLYVLLQDEVVILALMHLKRKPGYWKQRLNSV
jgi:plasmid stabilization system protein ParE